MTKIRPNLYLGGCVSADNLELLKAKGVTAVLNVAKDHNGRWGSGLKYVKIGLLDNRYNAPYLIDLAVAAINTMLDEGETVFCHCVAGASRSCHVVAVALAGREGRSYYDVWEELDRIHPSTCGGSPLAENPKDYE